MAADSWRRPARHVAVVTAVALTGSLAVTPVADATTYRRASNGAKIVGFKWIKQGSQFDFTIRSNALGGRYKVRVLVPRTWRMKSTRTWPTLYAYQGGREAYTAWTRSGGIESLASKYDVMVVMPAGNNGSYTNWWNSGRRGLPMWETFHTLEVRDLVERNFHAGGSRACMGVAAGGQGCVTYAARFPRMFRYAASYSGVLSLLSPGIPPLLLYTMTGTPGTNPLRVYGHPVYDKYNWVAHDPTSLARRLRGIKLYISAGTTGQPGAVEPKNLPKSDTGLVNERSVGFSNVVFRNKLRSLKIPVTAHFYNDGRHSWPHWSSETKLAWPSIMATLGAHRL